MKINKLPPLDYLNECFSISKESPTGLMWKSRPRHHFATNTGHATTNGARTGTPAGALKIGKRSKLPRYVVRINNVLYAVSRIVYSMANSVELGADVEVDHIDCISTNNDPENLRESTRNQNEFNKTKYSNNTSGHKGLFWCKLMNKWYGKVGKNKKYYKTIYFSDKEAAVKAIEELRASLHSDFTNHR